MVVDFEDKEIKDEEPLIKEEKKKPNKGKNKKKSIKNEDSSVTLGLLEEENEINEVSKVENDSAFKDEDEIMKDDKLEKGNTTNEEQNIGTSPKDISNQKVKINDNSETGGNSNDNLDTHTKDKITEKVKSKPPPKINDKKLTKNSKAPLPKHFRAPSATTQISSTNVFSELIEEPLLPSTSKSNGILGTSQTGLHTGAPMGLPEDYDITIFQAAQHGNMIALGHLLEKDPSLVSKLDEGKVSALHWASINNRLEAAKYLIDNGADVNMLGGDLNATPLHWACRQGLLEMMVILIENGADVALKDTQGFNILHLSIHSFNLPSLIYSMSFQEIYIDEQDAQGHTPLMWAAYQGFPVAVQILLKAGADVTKRDQSLFTPLHWAVVKGSREIITELIIKGSDLHALDDQGKSPKDAAINSKTVVNWEAALNLANYNPKTLKKYTFTLSAKRTKQILAVLPLLSLPLFFFTFVSLPWALAIPFFLLESFIIFKLILQYVMKITLPKVALNETPMLASVFLTSCFLVFINYFTTILKHTLEELPITNFIFSSLFATALYYYFDSTLSNPGSIKKNSSIKAKSGLIRNLAKVNMLNNRQFCTTCFITRPPRSKHCKFCDRCILKFDHHCPWIHNCIGSNNHRQFIIFTSLLVIGISFYEYLGYQYLINNINAYIPQQIPCFLTEDMCAMFQLHSFTCYTMLWIASQASWLVILLVYQGYLIANNQTTNESLNHDKYNMGIPLPSGETITGSDGKKSGCLRLFSKGGENRTQRSTNQNKYDKGIIGNCSEFWFHKDSNPSLSNRNTHVYQELPLEEIRTE